MTFYKSGKSVGTDAKSAVSKMSDNQVAQIVFEYVMNVYGTDELAEMVAYGNIKKPRTIAEEALDALKGSSKSYGGITWSEPKAPAKKAPAKKAPAKKKSSGISPELMDLARELNWALEDLDPYGYYDAWGDYPSNKALKSECIPTMNDPSLLEIRIDEAQWVLNDATTDDEDKPRWAALLKGLEARLEEIQPGGSKKSSRSNNRKPRTAGKPIQWRR